MLKGLKELKEDKDFKGLKEPKGLRVMVELLVHKDFKVLRVM